MFSNGATSSMTTRVAAFVSTDPMHILFVSPWLPSVAGGASTRTYHLIRELASHYAISLLCFLQPHEKQMLPAIERYCKKVVTIPCPEVTQPGKWRNRMEGWFRLLLERSPDFARTYPTRAMREPIAQLVAESQFDLVQIESLLLAEIKPTLPRLPVILSTQNVEHVVARRKREVAKNVIHQLRDEMAWRKLAGFERFWVPQFAACLAVSEGDRKLLGKMTALSRVHIVQNGVDCAYFAPGFSRDLSQQYDLVFVGTMHYQPNVDGILYFCHEIWPLIRQALPDTSLAVVGSRPAPEVLTLRELPGVTVTGFVDDIRRYFWQARASIVPLRIGGGSRLKILESLAAGVPVVSTTVGAEGLALESGLDYLLGDTPQAFAESTVRLITDDHLRERLVAHGQSAVRARYDWQVIGRQLHTVYEDILEGRKYAGC